MRFTSSSVLLFAAYFLVITSRDAWAYLDPMGGSMLIQLIVGGLVSGLVMAKIYWKRVLDMIGIGRDEDSTGQADNTDED